MSRLSARDRLIGHQLSLALDKLPDWHVQHEHLKLQRTFAFAGFAEAFAFMSEVARVAEAHDHHPEWTNVWNRVDIMLTTHSAAGITLADIELAQAIDEIAGQFELVCAIGAVGTCGACL